MPICSQFRFYICYLGEFVKNVTQIPELFCEWHHLKTKRVSQCFLYYYYYYYYYYYSSDQASSSSTPRFSNRAAVRVEYFKCVVVVVFLIDMVESETHWSSTSWTCLVYFSLQDIRSGSDYTNFYQRLGIPCVDIRYTYDRVSIVCNKNRQFPSCLSPLFQSES